MERDGTTFFEGWISKKNMMKRCFEEEETVPCRWSVIISTKPLKCHWVAMTGPMGKPEARSGCVDFQLLPRSSGPIALSITAPCLGRLVTTHQSTKVDESVILSSLDYQVYGPGPTILNALSQE